MVSTKKSTDMLTLENALFSMGNLTSILINQFKPKDCSLENHRLPVVVRRDKKGTWALLPDGKL